MAMRLTAQFAAKVHDYNCRPAKETAMIKKLIAACVALAFALTASAQESYPTRTITIVVPFAAGGPTDTVTRLVAQSMSKALGQSVIVENVAGAGGTIGVEK